MKVEGTPHMHPASSDPMPLTKSRTLKKTAENISGDI